MLRKLVILLMVGIVLSFGAVGFAGVQGSDHDLSGKISGLENLCYPCHTPHNAGSLGDMPLWQSRTSSLGTFTLYNSASLDATLNQPDGMDAACLYCHSGTIAIDEWAGGSTTMNSHILGMNLSDDHPISFTYDATLASNDGGLAIPADDKGSNLAPLRLFGWKMRCASCHNPHDDTNGDFLRATGTQWCSTCHNNK